MTEPHRRWRCAWIWAPGTSAPRSGDLFAAPPESGEEDVLLRRMFSLAAAPRAAPARVVADSRYALWVNGALASRGPVRGDAAKLRYDAIDLAPFLRAGPNVLAVRARYYGSAVSWWAPARHSLSLGRRGAFAFEADLGGGVFLGSDAAWRAHRCVAFTHVPPSGISHQPIDAVDARLLPAGWEEPDFDDAAWPAAEALATLSVGGLPERSPPSQPYGALRPRPIPQLEGSLRTPRSARVREVAGGAPHANPVDAVAADEASALRGEREAALPLVLAPGGVSQVLLDFGEVVSGLVGIEVEAEAGVTLDLAAREDVEPGGFGGGTRAGLRYVTRGDRDAYRSFDPIGLRWALVSVRGATRPVTLRGVTCLERLYPQRGGACFECSDPVLNRVYEAGKRTVALNAHDAYLDCPTREQRAWAGDAVVHQMVHLTTNEDWGLARWHPELAASPRPDGLLPMAAGGDLEGISATIPEWSLHWIRSVWNLWRYTGDRELVRSLLPYAETVLRWLLPYRGAHGLACHVEQWVLVDWAALHHRDTSACLNAHWARALLEFAEMSEWLGDAGRAGWARGLHAELGRAFELFWDEARGSYVDHAVDGVPQRPMSQHAGATALWAGLVPEHRRARVLATITDRRRLIRRTWVEMSPGAVVTGPVAPDWDVEREIVAAEPFYRFVVHDAVAGAGRAEWIPSLCRDWEAFLARGETTWPEMWNAGTHCHGWSSTPTRDLVMYTLGITPAEPGFACVRVAPRLGDLAFARGAAPTPHGLVRVDATPERVAIESPVPVLLDRAGCAPERLPAGKHAL
jgi:hypothetical protein